jgi:uncharacterized protein
MILSAAELLRTHGGTAFATVGARFAYLYGSAARGEAGPRSDVDVAVSLAEPPADILQLRLDLAAALEHATGLRGVVVTVLEDAPLPLVGRVLRDRIVVFSVDEPARVAYESLRSRQFLDFDIHARRLDRELLRAHADGRR